MKTVACRVDLGYTRIAGYTLYDTETMDFQETTPKEVWNLVIDGKVNGLTYNSKGEVIPDFLGWNMGNMKIKSGIGNYRNYNEKTEKTGTVYSVVRAIDVDGVGRVYELISHKCARITFTAEQLIELSKLAWIGGAFINEDTGEIQLCNNVVIENHTQRKFIELGSKVLATSENEAHDAHDAQKNNKSKTKNNKDKKNNK